MEGMLEQMEERSHMSEEIEEIRCEKCNSNNLKIMNHKPAVFYCLDCTNVWRCPEMEIVKENFPDQTDI